MYICIYTSMNIHIYTCIYTQAGRSRAKERTEYVLQGGSMCYRVAGTEYVLQGGRCKSRWPRPNPRGLLLC